MSIPAWAMTEITGDQLFAVFIGITLLMSLLASFWWCLRRGWHYRPRDIQITKTQEGQTLPTDEQDEQQEQLEEREIPFTTTWAGWAFLCFLIMAGGVLLHLSPYRSPPLLFAQTSAWLAVITLVVATCLHEVRDPDHAFLYRAGCVVGRLSPGWYLTIPHLWDIVIIPMEWTQITFEESEVYTNGSSKEPRVTVRNIKGVTQIRPRKDAESLRRILRMPAKKAEEFARAVALSALRREIGRRLPSKILREKQAMEESARKTLADELARHGYEQGDWEVFSFDSPEISRVAEGSARAQAEGGVARAVAEPLKQNYPGAIGVAAHQIGEPIGRGITAFVQHTLERANKPSRSSQQQGSGRQRTSPEEETVTVQIPRSVADTLTRR